MAREEAEQAEQQRLMERNRRLARYQGAFPLLAMGQQLEAASLENFEPREGAEKALRFATMYAQGLPNPDPPGLILYGSVGNGKSHLGAAIAHQAADQHMAVVWIHTPSWLRQIGTMESERREELIRMAAGADLLILDELGGGKLTLSRAEWLLSILDERYRRRMPFVATTNLSLAELERALTPADGAETEMDVPSGARMVDRLVEMSLTVPNEAGSYRLEMAQRRIHAMREV